jgi:drug/metabolite transporter (DMT)-like permease
MEHLWIWLAVAGAALQAIRTAAQRDLNRHLSTLATTYVRSLFGLPLLAIYLVAVMALTGEGIPAFGMPWLLYTLAGAMTQVVATALLIRMFTLRSFGVGTMLTKVDIVITAILGALLFSETLSALGVMALVVVLAGVVLMSLERTGKVSSVAVPDGGSGISGWLRAALSDKSLGVALGCAFTFSLSFLTYREAALVIGEGSFLWRGAWTVLLAILMQTVIVGAWLAWREPGLRQRLAPHIRICTFIGATSAVGSICWFTAFALQNASYVRAVGQIEVVFTLLVSALYYRERISALEYAGIALTMAGVLIFRLAV